MPVMIDLETMGNNPDAPIVSIGAVFFTLQGVSDRTFYKAIDLESAMAEGGRPDASTIIWWLKQSDEARSAIASGTSVGSALTALTHWFDLGGASGVWGNGATFDNVILRRAYERRKMQVPWPFWADRCYRTVKNMCPHIEIARTGTHHNALDDAISQAEHLVRIWKAYPEMIDKG